MAYLFTSESVSEGHPDKVADQISDAVLDKLLAYDAQSHVACETLVTTGQVIVAGEVSSDAYIDITRNQSIVLMLKVAVCSTPCTSRARTLTAV